MSVEEHSLVGQAGGALKGHSGWTIQDSCFPERPGSNGVMVKDPKAVQAGMKPRDHGYCLNKVDLNELCIDWGILMIGHLAATL